MKFYIAFYYSIDEKTRKSTLLGKTLFSHSPIASIDAFCKAFMCAPEGCAGADRVVLEQQ